MDRGQYALGEAKLSAAKLKSAEFGKTSQIPMVARAVIKLFHSSQKGHQLPVYFIGGLPLEKMAVIPQVLGLRIGEQLTRRILQVLRVDQNEKRYTDYEVDETAHELGFMPCLNPRLAGSLPPPLDDPSHYSSNQATDGGQTLSQELPRSLIKESKSPHPK